MRRGNQIVPHNIIFIVKRNTFTAENRARKGEYIMIQLLIIADDFTGALDTGVQFSACGAKTKVIVGDNPEIEKYEDACDVLVIDAETRHMPADCAGRIVAQITTAAVDKNIPHIFKKTDSALRGNIGAELSAVLEAAKEAQLPFIPSFPQIGRTTENGEYLISGIAVADSVFGSDPFEPVTKSNVSELIALQSSVPCISLPVPTSAAQIPEDKGILVFDSRTREDLIQIMKVLKEKGLLRIIAGCAGFASILSEILDISEREKTAMPELDPRLLVVCGSVNPITLTQLHNAQQKGFTRYHLSPEQKLGAGYWETRQGILDIEAIRKMLADNPHCIIDSNDIGTSNAQTREYARQHNIDLDGLRLGISHSIGHIVKSIFNCPDLGTMLITGGDTLLQCMKYMGVNTLEPVCEMESGIVLSRFSYEDHMRYVITKSGGFGSANLMSNIADMISKESGINQSDY